MVLLEHLVFRRNIGYDKEVWDTPGDLPSGVPALFSWACGFAMAFLGADQTWLVGPIANAIGGADIGFELVSFILLERFERSHKLIF